MNNRIIAILSATAVAIFSSCGMGEPAYKNPGLSSEKRTADLIKRMTTEEKIGQLLCPLGWPMYHKEDDGSITITEEYVKFIGEQNGGMIYGPFRADPWTRKTLEDGLNPALEAKTYNILQKYAIEHSRLGIPIIFAEECPHGHMAIGTTVFPTGIGLASTWSPETMTEVGKVIASEMRAQGGHIGYGPVIDLAREPRWSRVEETMGEDGYLTAQMAAGLMRGTSPKYNGYDKGIASTLKHFIAYGIPEGGHNGNPSFIGPRDLNEYFLPAFKSAIDNGALSVMTSYNAIDGEPTSASRKYLTDLLRDQWGFDGIVVSDLQSIDGLASSHHIATDFQEAGELSLHAGIDVDLGANCYSLLAESLKSGKISEKELDQAVSRVLKLKFDMGLFDNPYIDEAGTASVRSEEHMAVAKKAALEGVTLLENNGILPLKGVKKIAVVGPDADNMYNQLGDYTAPQERSNVKTMLDGIKAKFGAENVIYAKGCAIRDKKSADIPSAVAAARAADVVVAVVGGSSARDFKTKYIDTGAAAVDEEGLSDMEAGEGYDRSTLDLLGMQTDLLAALKQTGKPLVVVYVEGRPLDKNWAKENADALLTMWYPGQEGGLALADVLVGDYNPAGRLPISVPRNVGQIPIYYNKRFPAGGGYVEGSAKPLYEFGYGLSYTKFEYSDLNIEKTGNASAKVSVNVKNVGEYDGDEVVQLYITDLVATTVRPQKQLKAFSRVNIKKGETAKVEFELGEDAFSLYNIDMKKVVEPGDFQIRVGASSEDIRLEGTLTL